MIAVDTSGLIAILRDEPEGAAFARTLSRSARTVMSAASLLEATLVLGGRPDPSERWGELDALIARAGIEVVAFDQAQAMLARDAFLRFGKGRHPAGLNFGDCAAYALARASNAPLLFKGEDFSRTDIPAA